MTNKTPFRALMKHSLIALVSSGRRKKSTFAAGLALLLGISLYIGCVYSFSFGMVLAEANVGMQYLPVILGLLSVFFCFILTVFAAGGILFGGKDNDLLFSLPVSEFTILLSRLTALYFEDLLIFVCMFLPSLVAYVLFGGALSLSFWLTALLAVFCLPFLSEFFVVVFGFLFNFLMSRTKHKNFFSNFIGLAFFGLAMVFSTRISSAMELVRDFSQVDAVLNTWLYPFSLLRDAISGNLLSLILFLAVCVLPFFVLCYLLSKIYRLLLFAGVGGATGNPYRLSKTAHQHGRFAALYKREFSRLFGINMYFLNSCIGSLLLIAAAVFLFFSDSASGILTEFGVPSEMAVIGILGVAFFTISTVTPDCVSISLEGKTFWILREAPITPMQFFGSKILVQLTCSIPAILIALPMMGIRLGLSVTEILCSTLLTCSFAVFMAVMGIQMNLWLPRMGDENDIVIIKQSGSLAVMLFGGFILGGLLCLGCLLSAPLMSLTVFALGASILLLLFSLLLLSHFRKRGEQLLFKLV